MISPMFSEERIDTLVPLNCAIGPPNGPRLLMLHGITRRWQDFVTLLPVLAMRWQVHALDFRGHGKSERRPGEYHVIDYVHDVGGFLTSRSPEPVVLYGHSLGALVAAAVAAQWPAAIRAVILEDPPSEAFVRNLHSSPFYAMFSGLRRLAAAGHSIDETTHELAELRLPGPNGNTLMRLGDLRDPTSLRFTARSLQDLDPTTLDVLLDGDWLAGYDYRSIFRAVRCPALLLRADENFGGMLPRSDADELAKLIASCCLVDFPRTGHLLHWMATETISRLVMGFLEAV
jgi:pimeloyl-ACP methyl ester carboxylesterase